MMTPPFPPSKREQQARENGEDLGTTDHSGTFFGETPAARGADRRAARQAAHRRCSSGALMLRCCLDGPNRRWSSKPDCVEGADPSTPASAFDTQARSSSQPAWAAGRASDFRLTITRETRPCGPNSRTACGTFASALKGSVKARGKCCHSRSSTPLQAQPDDDSHLLTSSSASQGFPLGFFNVETPPTAAFGSGNQAQAQPKAAAERKRQQSAASYLPATRKKGPATATFRDSIARRVALPPSTSVHARVRKLLLSKQLATVLPRQVRRSSAAAPRTPSPPPRNRRRHSHRTLHPPRLTYLLDQLRYFG
ncbi:hypothetical protein L1887_58377 [Cichorium endivia]|nr:hypothetical protein L1887_58377 [Cichorium endivia]